MRKITSLLTLLLLFVAGTAVAQPDVNGKTFTLNCARGYVYYNGSVLAGTSDASKASEFAFVNFEDNVYLYDVTKKAFVSHTTAATAGTTGNAALESNSDLSKVAKGFAFGTTGLSNYPYYLYESEYGNWLNMDGTPLVYLNTWKDFEGGAGGNTYNVTIVNNSFDDTEAQELLDLYYHPGGTITYRYLFNGVEMGSEELNVKEGKAFPTPTFSGFGYSFETPSGTVAASDYNTTKDIELTWTLFKYADSFDNISQWYYVRMHSNQTNYLYNNGGSLAFTGAKGNNEYLFGFVGNPIDGFQIYSYTGGSSVAIDNATPSTLSADGTSVNFKVTSVKKGNKGEDAGACFALYVTAGNYLNYQGGNIARWSQTDEGSAFMIDEAEVITDDAAFNDLKAQIQAYSSLMGENIGQYQFTGDLAGNTVEDVVSELKAFATTYGYTNAKAAAEVALASIQQIVPADGYYRIKNVSTGKYIRAKATYGTRGGVVADVDDPSGVAGTVIEIRTVDGLQYMIAENGWFNWVLTAAYGTNYSAWIGDSKDKYVHWAYNGTPGQVAFAICYGNGVDSYAEYLQKGFFYVYNEDGLILGGDQTNAAGQWILEEANTLEITLNSDEQEEPTYYATLYAPFDVTLPAGFTAYTLTLDGEKALENSLGQNVPAGTAVVVEGSTNSATATITTGLEAFSGSNALNGSYFSIDAADMDGKLALGISNAGVVGFFQYNFALNANRAYLNVPSGVRSVLLFDNDEVTGINGVSTVNSQWSTVYDLQGRRVNAPAKGGVYIVNGKKVLF